MLGNESETITYDMWNKTLFEYFFNEKNKGKIIYLYVTDELIAELGEKYGLSHNDSINSFRKVVSTYERGNPENIFMKAKIWGEKWYKQGKKGAPPFIGILSMCVLAASRMNQSNGVTSANYYYRLRELLCHKGSTQDCKIKHFKETEPLWNYLEKWLRSIKGEFGFVNAFQFGQRYVGYPKSQCLIREKDKKDLYNFFQWAKYSPYASDIDKEEMKGRLLIYFHNKNNRLARYLKESQSQNGLEDSLIRIVQNELHNWDGSISSEPSPKNCNKLKKEMRINLWFEKNKKTKKTLAHLELYANVDGLEELFDFGFSFRRVNNYLIRSIESVNELKNRINYKGENEKKIHLFHNEKEIYVFERGYHENLQGWIQSTEFMVKQQYLLLFRRDNHKKVKRWLEINKLESQEFSIDNIEGDGWCLLFIELGEDKPVYNNLIDERIEVNENRRAISWRGGLKLHHNEWLLEALPILTIRSNKHAVVSINGKETFCLVDPNSINYSLQPTTSVNFKQLLINKPGTYEFSVNGDSQKIFIRGDSKSQINFDNFEPEKHNLNIREISIAGTYIYANDSNIKLSPKPFIQTANGEAKVAYGKNHYNTIRFDPQINAPPFARDIAFIPIDFLEFSPEFLDRPIELLLEYLTVKKEGNWEEFLVAIQYLFNSEIQEGKNKNLIAYTVRRNLAKLGMVEFIKIPYTTKFNWKVNPPSVAVIPSSSVLVVITGGRTRRSILDIKNNLPYEVNLKCSDPNDLYEPTPFYLKSHTEKDARNFLESSQIVFNWGEDYFAYHLLRILPTLNELVFSIKAINSTSIPPAEKKEYWDPDKHKWTDTVGILQRVHFNEFNRTSYITESSTELMRPVDKEIGKIFAAQRKGSSIFLYRPYQFFVRKEYHLPDLYERCITSCIGKSPVEKDNFRLYENVPFEIAISLSVKLGFKLLYI
ncbi:hypothetical protein U0355_13000 [Salimicrobium sp. PL1-032A]|uniref:hypothetical protein n=1 Tax=Salimicrobium sp. PL1-032A TaxID=3095364 RepID=UPI0032612747